MPTCRIVAGRLHMQLTKTLLLNNALLFEGALWGRSQVRHVSGPTRRCRSVQMKAEGVSSACVGHEEVKKSHKESKKIKVALHLVTRRCPAAGLVAAVRVLACCCLSGNDAGETSRRSGRGSASSARGRCNQSTSSAYAEPELAVEVRRRLGAMYQICP